MAEEETAQPGDASENDAPESDVSENDASEVEEHVVTPKEVAEANEVVEEIEVEIAAKEAELISLHKKRRIALEKVPAQREATLEEQQTSFKKNFLRMAGAPSSRVPVTRAPSNVRTGSFS